MFRFLASVLALLLTSSGGLGISAKAALPGCTSPIAPIGTNTVEAEPAIPIWCVSGLVQPQQTGGPDNFGGWIDSFQNTIPGSTPAHLNTGEIGYQTFENISAGGGSTLSQHWEANGYFLADLRKGATDNGTDLSPAEAFSFQGGKLVLEGDVSAAYPGFADSNGGDIVWPEIDWSTLPAPNTDQLNDNLYLYGYFAGGWAGGCRLQGARSLTCSVQADHNLTSVTGDQAPCFSQTPARLMELSGFQQCGSTHSGFSVDFGAPSSAWRVCSFGNVDSCMDRFRFEWSKTGFQAWINGIKFAEDSGWPAQAQLPDSVVNGSTPIYAHFGEFGDFSDGKVYRFHWQRIAVNPHGPDGIPSAPSATCQFLGNCAGLPAPSPTPSASPTPVPSPTPTPAPTPTACTLSFGSTTKSGTCSFNSDGSITFVGS